MKKHVVKLVSVHDILKPEERIKLAHSKLSRWVSKARRRFPAEIFTTNYDYLFEIALEGSGIPYFDGFSGSYEPFFCLEAVEGVEAYPHLVKLWKMHGSLGWTYRESDRAVIRDKSAPAESILIYPSHLKYNTSKKQPYVCLIDRLCTADSPIPFSIKQLWFDLDNFERMTFRKDKETLLELVEIGDPSSLKSNLYPPKLRPEVESHF